MIFLFPSTQGLSGGVEQFETLSRYSAKSFLCTVFNMRVNQSVKLGLLLTLNTACKLHDKRNCYMKSLYWMICNILKVCDFPLSPYLPLWKAVSYLLENSQNHISISHSVSKFRNNTSYTNNPRSLFYLLNDL